MRLRLPSTGCRALLCAFLFIILISLSLHAEEPEIVDTFFFPFVIDGVFVDDIEVGLDMFFEPKFLNTQELYAMLSRRMREDTLSFLLDTEWISFAQLKAGGISITYDPMTLELRFSVPPEAAIPMSFSLKRPPITRFGIPVEPVDFSFYTNIYTSLSYNTTFDEYPVRFDSLVLEPNLYHRNWVIESRLPFSYLFMDNFELSNSWLVRGITFSDDTNSRLIIEDAPGTDTGTGRRRSIVYEKSRLTGLTPRSNSNYELSFLVEEPTSLTLRLNDRNIFSRRVSQGEYFFDGFTLTPGVNEITYTLEQEDKEPTSKTVRIPYDQSLVPMRDNDYSIGLSFSSYEAVATDPLNDLRLFGTLRMGLTHTLTGSYGIKISAEKQEYDLGFSLATLHGNYFHTSSLIFKNDPYPNYIGSLRYQFFDRFTNRSFGLSGGINTENSDIDLAMTYSQTLFPSLSFSTSFGVNYAWEDDEPFTPRASTTLRHRLRISPTSSLLTDAAVTDWIDFTFQVSAFLSVSLAQNRISANARQTVRRTYDDEENTFTTEPATNINAVYRPSRTSPFGPVSLGLSRFDYDTMLPGNVGLSGTYTDSFISARLQQNMILDDTFRYNANLRLNTALAYADRTLVLTRPISNSFVLVKPGAALEGIDIGVNPRSGAYAATTENIFNTAILPNIPAFTETSVILEPFELPDDAYFSENQFRFSTRYKQAVVIRPGADFRVMLTGRLFYREGEPLVFAAGDITPKDPVDEDDMQFFFTDDTGRLFAFDLTPGEYNMNIYLRDRIETITLVIPDTVRGTATIGDVFLLEDELPTIETEESDLVSLRGRLFYEDGTPAAFVRGQLVRNGEAYSFLTGENGFFTVMELEPGTYEMVCDDAASGEFLEIVIPEGIGRSVSVGNIFLSGRQEAFDVTEVIPDGISLTGRILHHDRTPLASAYVELVPESSAAGLRSYSSSTDASGQFSISQVDPGTYLLSIPVEGRYLYYRIIVPDDSEGVLTLGNISLPGSQPEERLTVPAAQDQ